MKFEVYEAIRKIYEENGWSEESEVCASAIRFFERVEQQSPVEMKIYGAAGSGKSCFLRCMTSVGIQCVAYSLGKHGRYVHLVRDGRLGGADLDPLPARVGVAKITDFIWRSCGGLARVAPDDKRLFEAGKNVALSGGLIADSPFLNFALQAELLRWRSLSFTLHGDLSERVVKEVAALRGFQDEKNTVANFMIDCHNEIRRGDEDEAAFMAMYVRGETALGHNSGYVIVCDDTEDMTPLELGVFRRMRQECYILRALDPLQNRLWVSFPDEDNNSPQRMVGEFFVSHRVPMVVARHLHYYNETMRVNSENNQGGIYKCRWEAMIEQVRPGDLIVVRTLDELVRAYMDCQKAGKTVYAVGRQYRKWIHRILECVKIAYPKKNIGDALYALREELNETRWRQLPEREQAVWSGLLDGLLRVINRFNTDEEEKLLDFWLVWAHGLETAPHANAVNLVLDVDCKPFAADCVWYVNQHQIPNIGETWNDYLCRIHYTVVSRTRGRLVFVAD